jgi:hypothetical protein
MVTNINQVATLNEAAVAAFNTFAERQRFRSNTNLVRFHRELEEKHGKVDEGQLLEVFKALEQAGAGSLILNRKPYKTRFAWNYSLRDVAKLAKGEIKPDELTKVKKPTKKVGRPAKAKPAPVAKEEETIEVIPVFPDDVKTDKDILIVDATGNVEKYSLSSENETKFKAIMNSLGLLKG